MEDEVSEVVYAGQFSPTQARSTSEVNVEMPSTAHRNPWELARKKRVVHVAQKEREVDPRRVRRPLSASTDPEESAGATS